MKEIERYIDKSRFGQTLDERFDHMCEDDQGDQYRLGVIDEIRSLIDQASPPYWPIWTGHRKAWEGLSNRNSVCADCTKGLLPGSYRRMLGHGILGNVGMIGEVSNNKNFAAAAKSGD